MYTVTFVAAVRCKYILNLTTSSYITLLDPQPLSARWRCLTYNAVDNRIRHSADWSDRFADLVLKQLSSIVSSLFGTSSDIFSARFRQELKSIWMDAYEWYHAV